MWAKEPRPSDAALSAFRNACDFALPVEYLALLQESNGGEGDLGVDPGWFQLWAVEELVELNAEYEVPTQLPGYFAFGGNGGGELFAICGAGARAGAIFMIPCVPLDLTEAVEIAP